MSVRRLVAFIEARMRSDGEPKMKSIAALFDDRTPRAVEDRFHETTGLPDKNVGLDSGQCRLTKLRDCRLLPGAAGDFLDRRFRLEGLGRGLLKLHDCLLLHLHCMQSSGLGSNVLNDGS